MAKGKPTKAKRRTVTTRLLDARPDRIDFRDLPYRPPLWSLPRCYRDDAVLKEYLRSYVDAGLVLDQGSEGARTGFGLACVVNYLLWPFTLDDDGDSVFTSPADGWERDALGRTLGVYHRVDRESADAANGRLEALIEAAPGALSPG